MLTLRAAVQARKEVKYMTDDTKGQNSAPVQVTQDAPVPSADQKTPEATQVETGAGQETVETLQPKVDEGLPEDSSDRTRREFEKLQNQLRQERQKRLEVEQKFRVMTPPPAPQPEPVIDPYTGQVDERLTQIQQKAWQAEQRALQAEQAVANFYTEQQRREAVIAHPELDSESKNFDKKLHVATRAIIMDSMVNPDDYGGKQLTYKEAADEAKRMRSVQVEQAKREAANEALEKLTPKEQASLEATGSPGRRSQADETLPDLQQRTRRGDLDAVMSRLKNIPSVGKG